MTDLEKIDSILRHIHNVQNNCEILGKRLIESYLKLDKREQCKSLDLHIGKNLIANGLSHDKTKFSGLEWDHLNKGDALLRKTVIQHNHTNPHHPEYWGDIHQMPDVYIAEMICDWKARSSEFGTDLKDYITNQATKRFKFKMNSEIGVKIEKYLTLLLSEPFS